MRDIPYIRERCHGVCDEALTLLGEADSQINAYRKLMERVEIQLSDRDDPVILKLRREISLLLNLTYDPVKP